MFFKHQQKNSEIICGKTPTDANARLLIFVHGSSHADWCFKNYRSYFEEKGYRTFFLNLRGHCENDEGPRWFETSLSHYVEDLRDALKKILPSPGGPAPVLIRHSLGTSVIIKALEAEITDGREIGGAILLCAIPPYGVGCATLRSLRDKFRILVETQFKGSLKPLWSTPERVRQNLFTERTEQSVIDYVADKVKHESLWCYFDMFYFWNRPRPGLLKEIPLLFIGAERDAIFSPQEIQDSANAYEMAELRMVPGGHDSPLLDVNWMEGAKLIENRLKDHNLTRSFNTEKRQHQPSKCFR